MRIRNVSRWIVVACALLVVSQAGLVLHHRAEIGLFQVLVVVCLAVVIAFQGPKLVARAVFPNLGDHWNDRLTLIGAVSLIVASAVAMIWID